MCWIRARGASPVMSELLNIEDLHLEFHTYDGVVKVLAGVDLKMRRGDVLGLVGETGCGKSMTALSVARLIPMPPGKITAGRVTFDGEDMLSKSESEMETFRASHLGMIFQDPGHELESAVYHSRAVGGRRALSTRARSEGSRALARILAICPAIAAGGARTRG